MNSYKIIPFFIVLIITLITCTKNESKENNNTNSDCVFVQNDSDMDGLIDDTEKMLMNQCIENTFSSKSAIRSNMIGEWELIGHGEGWLPTYSQPCGYITISENELALKFSTQYTDTTTVHQWEIEQVSLSAGQYYRLKIIPQNVEGLFINHFCENYMFGDATPSDGNMYLYKKVK